LSENHPSNPENTGAFLGLLRKAVDVRAEEVRALVLGFI
jgi:hypothetical protein